MKKLILLCLIICSYKLSAQICFNAPKTFAVGATAKMVRSTDFDKNGLIDMITVNDSGSGAEKITVLMNYNNSTSSFSSKLTYALGAGYSLSDIGIADFDGDSIKDIVVTDNYSPGRVIFFPGNGTAGIGNGTFGTGVPISVNNYLNGLTIGYFNGDAKPDVAVISNNSGSLIVLTNTSTAVGSFGFSTASVSTSYPSAIVSADFSGDGKTDIAVTSSSNNNVSLFINSSGTFSTPNSYATGSSPTSITFGNFDGTIGLDIATASSSATSGYVSVLLNNGTGSFGVYNNYGSPTNYGEGINNGDFDLDGKLDIAIMGYGTSSGLFIFRGNGTGTFATGVQTVNTSTSGSSIPLIKGDYNADGITDLAYLLNNNTLNILMNAKPVVTGVTSFCSGGSTILTAHNATSYAWSTGGNNDTIHVNNLATTTVYTVTGTTGSCSAATTSTVTVMPLPTVGITGSGTICSGNSITLMGTNAFTYTWSTGSTNVNISVTPGVTTQYTLSGSDANGCTNTVTTIITVNASPAPSANTTGGAICAAQPLFLTTPTSAAAYSWSGPNGFTSTLQNPTITNATPAASGTYTLTVTNANGCTGSTYVNATVNVLPTISVNSGTICSGNNIVLSAAGANTYTWVPAVGLSSSTGYSVNASPTSTTIYTVAGTDLNGCIGTGTSTLTVNQLPIVTVNSPTICYASTATLSANIGALPGYTVLWTNGATVNTTTVNPLSSIQYGINVTDVNGCTANAVANVTVLVNDDITGTIYDTTTVTGIHPITSGLVYLYPQQISSSAIDTTGLLSSVIYTSINTSTGVYTLSNIPGGNYYVKAEANIVSYPGSVATYLSTRQNKAFRWDSATVVTHLGCGNGTDAGHDISIIELPAQTGTGVISGTITADPSFGGRYASGGHNQVFGSPLKGADVKLGKSPGGGCSARTVADTSGAYTFTGVDTGSYSIYVDIPNYGMVTILTTTISPANPQSLNNNYCVDSVNINVCTSSVGIKQNVNNNYNVSIYPNPNNGIFNLQVSEHENMSVEVYSVIGQKVYAGTLQNNFQSLNISTLNDGVYFVRVLKNNSVVYQTKICKQ